MDERPSKTIALLLALAHLAMAITALTGPEQAPIESARATLMASLAVTQIGLLGLWANLATRSPVSAVCALCVCLCSWNFVLQRQISQSDFTVSAGLLLVHVTILCQLGRHFQSCRQAIREFRANRRFTLRGLLVLTLAIALLLGYPQWLARLHLAGYPVFTVTVACGAILLPAALLGTIRPMRVVALAWLLLLGIAWLPVQRSVDFAAWFDLTGYGFALTTGFVLASLSALRVGGWPILSSSPAVTTAARPAATLPRLVQSTSAAP